MVKLNTDGSALDNPGRIGIGGILRNSQGDIIFAFAAPVGEGTNNQSEVQAAVFGLIWCIQLGYRRVVLGVDSELLMKWIKHSLKPPWSVKHHLDKLHSFITQFKVFKCIHTYTKANFTPNMLSKHSHKCSSPQLYFSKDQLPREARVFFELDKVGMANFRGRKLKSIKIPP